MWFKLALSLPTAMNILILLYPVSRLWFATHALGSEAFKIESKTLDQPERRYRTRVLVTNNSTFEPLLPPAIPLAVRSPYLSAWLATGEEGGNGGYLPGRWAQFWPIQFPPSPTSYRLGWAGLIRVNGQTYEFLGQPNDDNLENGNLRANQISFRYTSSQSIFELEAGGVRFLVTFLSPIPTEGDLLRQSLPFSYLSVELLNDKSSNLTNKDEVMIYTDIQSDWASGDHNTTVTWARADSDHLTVYRVGRKYPSVFSEKNEYAEWGEAVYATKKIRALTTASGVAKDLRKQFVSWGKLNGAQDTDYRVISDRTAGFGFSAPLTRGDQPLVFAIGHVRDPYLQSIEKVPRGDRQGTMVQKWGYWRTKFSDANDAINFFLDDYSNAFQTALAIDKKIEDDAKRLGGDDYVAITSLSVRQALGAMELVVSKDAAGNFDASSVTAFQKEISSNGDMSTVDVFFPQFPCLAYLDPALLKLALEPVFKYCESGLYPNRWTVHDLGRYPNATGHNDGKDEAMPVEETGNILIMVLSYYQLTRDAAWITKHYKILKQWAQFLVDDGLIPENQLSTDDINGKLANQTNLALKAIVGIGAMSQIALATGDNDTGSKLRSTAEDYISKWGKMALNDGSTHIKLAYQINDSWGTLYNLFGDRILNLKLVPEVVYQVQDKFYPLVSNEYGVPLDYRHTWATTYWQLFAAGASLSTQTRDLFISGVFNYLKANKVNGGFPDLYDTQNAQYPGRSPTSTWKIEFVNRPVVGGHFSMLALDKANKANGVLDLPFKP